MGGRLSASGSQSVEAAADLGAVQCGNIQTLTQN